MKKYSSIIYSLIIVFFLLILAYPLSKIFYLAFKTNTGINFSNFSDIFKDSIVMQGVTNSFILALGVAICSTIIGFIIGYTRNFLHIPQWYKNFLEIFANFPMFLPTIVYGFALIYIFGRQGILTQLMGGKTIITVFGPQGVFLGLLIYTIPVSFMLINDSMKYIDSKLFVVSKLMGDNSLKQFVTCLIRPLRSTIILSFIQCFFLSFTDFGLPTALAGNYPLLSTSLYIKMLGAIPDFAHGSVVALLMLLPTIVTTIIMVILQKYNTKQQIKSSLVVTSGRITKMVYSTISATLLLSIVLIFIPIFIVPFVSVYPYNMSFTFQHFSDVFSDFTVTDVIQTSLILSLLTAFFGTLLALTSAYLASRSSIANQVSKVMNFISNVTNAVPGMVLGIALMIAVSGTGFQYTLTILIMANCVHLFATPFSMANGAFHKLSANLEKTSELMGDNFIKTIFRVVLPNIRQTIFEMMNYLFVNSMVTISAIIFLVGVNTSTITTKMKELQNFNRYDQVFVLALVLFSINFVMKYIFYILGNLSFHKKIKIRQ
ncbi:MAG: ABC transporter permease subunit [Streptococcaceae bacterium]|nr:ABC transporter permease subunit [Streptococcaceae bacterium]